MTIIRYASGKSEIRLLSSKITLFGVKITRIKSHDNVVLLSPWQLRSCAQSICQSLTSIVGWKAKDLGRLVNLKILLVNSFPALTEDQLCPIEMSSYKSVWPVIPEIQKAYNWKKCWKWKGQNLQIKTSEVETLWVGTGLLWASYFSKFKVKVLCEVSFFLRRISWPAIVCQVFAPKIELARPSQAW